MPNGYIGSWNGEYMMVHLGTTNTSTFKKGFSLINIISEYNYYISNDNKKAMITRVINNHDTIVCELIIGKYTIKGVSEAIQTNMIKSIIKEKRLATNLYTLLLKNHVLVCDYDQYDGARALWKSLGKKDLYPYVYNEIKETLSVVNNFDDEEALWSFKDTPKEHILLVLSTKKLEY